MLPASVNHMIGLNLSTCQARGCRVAPGARHRGEEFRRACGRFATGVTIASVLDAAGRAPRAHGEFLHLGFAGLRRWFSSASATRSAVIDAFRAARFFGINVSSRPDSATSRSASRARARTASTASTGRRRDRRSPAAGVLAPSNAPTRQRFTAGDHDIFVGEMVRAQSAKASRCSTSPAATARLPTTWFRTCSATIPALTARGALRHTEADADTQHERRSSARKGGRQ